MVLDISLFSDSEEEIDDNMKTLAYLIIINNRSGLDVNYILRGGTVDTQKELSKERLLLHLRQLSEIHGQDLSGIEERINIPHSDARTIEINIMKVEDLQSMSTLPENFFPVAMSDGNRNTGFTLRDIVSAFAIGMTQAACERIRMESGSEQLKEVVISEMLSKLREIYKRVFPGEKIEDIVTVETILNMVDTNPIVRKNLAIALALPPIIRIMINELKEYHEHIHMLLSNA